MRSKGKSYLGRLLHVTAYFASRGKAGWERGGYLLFVISNIILRKAIVDTVLSILNDWDWQTDRDQEGNKLELGGSYF